jgi:hypothetical protein
MELKQLHHQWLVEHIGDSQCVIRRPYDPNVPTLGAVEFSSLFQERLVAAAVESPTLTEAFAFVSFWIGAAAQRSGNQFLGSHSGVPYLIRYHTCSEVIAAVREEWIARAKPMLEFQPSFTPPSPSH